MEFNLKVLLKPIITTKKKISEANQEKVRRIQGGQLTDLRLGHHGVVPVAEGREVEAHLVLHVPLLEELLHAPGSPVVVQVPPGERERVCVCEWHPVWINFQHFVK